MDGEGEAMIARRAAVASGALSLIVLLSAHIGSPDTWYEGAAGPYRVRVLVRAPQVIPAQAEIVVRVLGCVDRTRGTCGANRVTATARVWNGGERGAPPPETAARVPGDSALWSLQLWIMRQGSFAVLVHVEGNEGAGTATVPFAATATKVLGMPRGFGLLLAALGVFLAAGLVTIAGAATREATLAPGTEPDAAMRERANRVRWVTAAAIVVILVAGRAWWNVAERAYAAALYSPMKLQIAARSEGDGRRVLRVALDSTELRTRSFAVLIPDHGKLMHLFLVKDGDLGALAHLHPVKVDSTTFESALPALPSGRYRVFADIVWGNGFAETMVSALDLSSGGGPWTPSDADDAMFAGAPKAPGGAPWKFDDGLTLTLEPGLGGRAAARGAETGADAGLHFVLRDATGMPATVDSYLGMAAHAVVVRDDGSVFVHLHPLGTASVGAQRALEAWAGPDTVSARVLAGLAAADTRMGEMGGMDGTFEFPYAFPRPGRYFVWVQFRREGQVRTAIFEVVSGAGH